ncbi:NUDIX hydrolase [Flavimobilis marinus]|uniref:ADP-ribose pyrophosphatase n=1 Tax=Flavimobilis marinus TaxID=285351 RepID=A0A1I2F0A5_9MICO|nr:NUDIX hydrolase [Flavimobilis marinus]SFE98118.1 ADP-ribose pyrophosphatase [Flavimobilis marinus]
MTDPLFDVARPRPVLASRLLHEGRIWDLRSDDVDLGEAGVVTREWIDHPGAVATIAVDDEGRVLLLRQFRHPVGRELWEPPAGLLDVAGEEALLAAQRELAEEADLRAATWHVLADYFTTPGGNNEALRVFLARDLSPVPEDERHVREDEEMSMVPAWVSLEEAVDGVLQGRLHNPSTVVGVLALAAARAHGYEHLRPGDAPWPERRA